MFADLSMDHSIFKEVISKKSWACKQRELTEAMVKDYHISVFRACKLTILPRTLYYYKIQKDDSEFIEVLKHLAFKQLTYLFRMLCAYIRRSG